MRTMVALYHWQFICFLRLHPILGANHALWLVWCFPSGKHPLPGTARFEEASATAVTHATAVTQDTRLMKTAGTISISIVIRSTVVAALGLILMFLTSPELTGLTIAILPVLLLALRFYSTLNKKYTREGLTSSAEASTIAEEVFGSIRTVSTPLLMLLSPRAESGLW